MWRVPPLHIASSSTSRDPPLDVASSWPCRFHLTKIPQMVTDTESFGDKKETRHPPSDNEHDTRRMYIRMYGDNCEDGEAPTKEEPQDETPTPRAASAR